MGGNSLHISRTLSFLLDGTATPNGFVGAVPVGQTLGDRVGIYADRPAGVQKGCRHGHQPGLCPKSDFGDAVRETPAERGNVMQACPLAGPIRSGGRRTAPHVWTENEAAMRGRSWTDSPLGR